MRWSDQSGLAFLARPGLRAGHDAAELERYAGEGS
jgi:hypothetical protein